MLEDWKFCTRHNLRLAPIVNVVIPINGCVKIWSILSIRYQMNVKTDQSYNLQVESSYVFTYISGEQLLGSGQKKGSGRPCLWICIQKSWADMGNKNYDIALTCARVTIHHVRPSKNLRQKAWLLGLQKVMDQHWAQRINLNFLKNKRKGREESYWRTYLWCNA